VSTFRCAGVPQHTPNSDLSRMLARLAFVRVVDRATSRLPRPWRTVVDWAVTLAVAAGCVLAFEAEVAKPFRIPSSSMEPTLHCARPALGCEAWSSDRVIACEICYRFSAPERGQIVVFHAPAAARACRDASPGIFVKRLIGLPGETVYEDAHAQIWIDGRRLSEPYVTQTSRKADEYRRQTWRIPTGSYFMLGDNRGGSCDSRVWGAVPRSSLIGPVVLTYWPPTRLSFDG
jgi:signal peptidase I